jgi:hypothetical protein
VDLVVMDRAERDGKFVVHLNSQTPRLSVADMMSLRW